MYVCTRCHIGVYNGLITIGHYHWDVFTTPLTQIMRTKRGQFQRFVLHASTLLLPRGPSQMGSRFCRSTQIKTNTTAPFKRFIDIIFISIKYVKYEKRLHNHNWVRRENRFCNTGWSHTQMNLTQISLNVNNLSTFYLFFYFF